MPEATATNTSFPSTMATLADLAVTPSYLDDGSNTPRRESELSLACRDAMTTHVALTALLQFIPRSGTMDPAMRESARYLSRRWEGQVAQVCATAATHPDDIALKATLVGRAIRFTDAAMIGPTARLAASLAHDVLSNHMPSAS